jgi:hypothetical protein
MLVQLFILGFLACQATSLRNGVDRKDRERRELAESPWLTIFNNDFEAGVGSDFSLPNSGDDATEHDLSADAIGANSGSKVIRLRDSGAHSIITSTLMDVSMFDQIEVSFYYRGEDLEDGDKFLMEFQNDDAGSWRVAKDFIQGGINGKEMNGKWSNQILRWILHDGTKPIGNMRIRFQNFGDNSDIVVSALFLGFASWGHASLAIQH